jgi:hypothetical protein
MIDEQSWMMTQKVNAAQLRVLNSVYIFQIHIVQVEDCWN